MNNIVERKLYNIEILRMASPKSFDEVANLALFWEPNNFHTVNKQIG